MPKNGLKTYHRKKRRTGQQSSCYFIKNGTPESPLPSESITINNTKDTPVNTKLNKSQDVTVTSPTMMMSPVDSEPSLL